MVLRVFVLALALPLLALIGQSPAQATDRDCGDFATQAAAQTFFLGAGPGDPHRLDADGDRVVCESNPCPCIGAGLPVPLVGQTNPPQPTPTPTPNAAPTRAVQRHRGVVVKVTDGDTLAVRIRGVGVRSVRLLGIDTPEVYGGRECGGDAASAHMDLIAPVGSHVRLESDPSQADRDRYGRWLRYVERKGLDVGREQIRRGLAQTYVYRDVPFRRTAPYRRTEKVAHDLLRGSWDLCW